MEIIAEVAKRDGKKSALEFIEKTTERFYRTLANGLAELIDEGIVGENTPTKEVLLICKKRGALK